MEQADFKFECPFCQQRIEVPSDMAGQIVDCPKCGKAIPVPIPPGVPHSFSPVQAEHAHRVAREDRPFCPRCGSEVRSGSRKCLHCGAFLDGTPSASLATRVTADIERQFFTLGGFIFLLIGLVLHSRGCVGSTFAPFYLLAIGLGVVALVHRQILGGLTLLAATFLVPWFLRPPFPPPRPPLSRSVASPPAVRRLEEPLPTPMHPLAESSGPAVSPAGDESSMPRALAVSGSTSSPAASTLAWPPPADPFRAALGAEKSTEIVGPMPAQSSTTGDMGTTQPSASGFVSTDVARPPLSAEPAVLVDLRHDPTNRNILARLRSEIRSLPEGESRIKAMTVYGLACLMTGRTEEGLAIRVYLARSAPTNELAGQLTGEGILESCPGCQGSGETQHACPDCGGQTRCSKCNGTGTITLRGLDGATRTVKCIRCEAGKCRRCRGTGQVKQPCATCKGARARLSEAKIRKAYYALLGIPLLVPDSPEPAAPQTSTPAPGPGVESPPPE